LKIIIDFDGTLTAEESQAGLLAEKSLETLAVEIIGVPYRQLEADYHATQALMLRAPYAYWWEVNGLIATYCNEGAFILNTTTLQRMILGNQLYHRAVTESFREAEYDPVVDCTNHLFHRHTAELSPTFRPAAREILVELYSHHDRQPIILTNSLATKVRHQLDTLGLAGEIAVLGDTRQYEMAPGWAQRFLHPALGEIQVWPISPKYQVDLRRPAYYQALRRAGGDGDPLVVVADTFSMPGALPLMMGIPFFLLRTPYTPLWCESAVKSHPSGHVLNDLADLPSALDGLVPAMRTGNGRSF
jgi:hypothetical protein